MRYEWNDGELIKFVGKNKNHYMLEFDRHGFLIPYGVIPCEIQAVEEYFMQMYPAAHPKHLFSKFDELDWLHFLTKDHKRSPKGILKLSYQP